MSGFGLSSPPTFKRIHQFPARLLLCCFILSYLFQLLFFPSPLFITIFSFLLALLVISPGLVHGESAPELSESKASLVLGIIGRAVAENLRGKVEHWFEEFHRFLELEASKIALEALSGDLGGNPVEVLEIVAKDQTLTPSDDLEEVSSEFTAKVKTLAGSLHDKEELEGLWSGKEEEEEEKEATPLCVNCTKQEGERRSEAATIRSESKVIGQRESETKESEHCRDGTSEDWYSPKCNAPAIADHKAGLWRSPDKTSWDHYNSKGEHCSPSLRGTGLTRRGKEWRRTLACKLLGERHNTMDGGESMDLLWEIFETGTVESLVGGGGKANKQKAINKFSSSSSGASELSYDYGGEEEEEENAGKMCGLLVLSRRNSKLVKISKALKGIRWSYHVDKPSKKS